MTKRREVTVLCWTIPEAAESLRLSENLLRDMVKSGQVRTVRWNSLDLVPTIEMHRLIDEALNNGGTLPAVATPDASRGPAAAVEAPGIGAAGPRDTGVLGEVRPTVGSSRQLPGRSTHAKRPAVGAAGLTNNAG